MSYLEERAEGLATGFADALALAVADDDEAASALVEDAADAVVLDAPAPAIVPAAPHAAQLAPQATHETPKITAGRTMKNKKSPQNTPPATLF